MITVTRARRSFGSFVALDDLDLEVPHGSLTALLGPSGSGKSTLLRAIAGLDELDSGQVTIDGVDVTGIPPQRRGIGFVFQHYAAFTHMTVADNVAFGLSVRRRPQAQIAATVDRLLDLVELAELRGRYPAQLSGGQRQRMALARALAIEPSVLLLDEPFGALDAPVRADLRRWLRRLHDEVPVTTLLVTHDREEALDVADRVAVLRAGRIEQVADPVEIYDRPVNDFVMSFLGQVSRLGGHLVRPHDIVLDRAAAPAAGARPELGQVLASVVRIVRLGFEVRVELREADGHELSAQLSRPDVSRLGLREGDWVRASAPQVRGVHPPGQRPVLV